MIDAARLSGRRPRRSNRGTTLPRGGPSSARARTRARGAARTRLPGARPRVLEGVGLLLGVADLLPQVLATTYEAAAAPEAVVVKIGKEKVRNVEEEVYYLEQLRGAPRSSRAGSWRRAQPPQPTPLWQD